MNKCMGSCPSWITRSKAFVKSNIPCLSYKWLLSFLKKGCISLSSLFSFVSTSLSLSVLLLFHYHFGCMRSEKKTTTTKSSTPFFFPLLGVFSPLALLPWQTWGGDWGFEPNSPHSATADIRSSSAIGEPASTGQSSTSESLESISNTSTQTTQ